MIEGLFMNTNESVYAMKLQAVNVDTADGKAKLLLSNAKKQMGMIPNMYTRMANLPALFETYNIGYNLFRSDGGFSAVEQEVVFLTISRENGCEYCMAAHSVVADMMSKVPVMVTEAIREDAAIPDARLAALSNFTTIMVNKRGRPNEQDVLEFEAAGFTEHHILGIILAISVKTISNYSNHIFHTPVDTAFKAREWSVYKLGRRLMQFFK